MMRFLIVDDHPLFREALRSAVRLVHADADIAEATSIEGALDVIAGQGDFDLALLDLSLPGTTGFAGLITLRTAYPKLPIVVISGHEDAVIVREAMSLGIVGYIPKSTARRELERAIGEVLEGAVYLPAEFMQARSQSETDQHQILKRLRDLTPQQLMVLDLMRRGLQNKEIAHALKIAETTVKAHVSEILRKLQVFTRTQAVIAVAKVDYAALMQSAQG